MAPTSRRKLSIQELMIRNCKGKDVKKTLMLLTVNSHCMSNTMMFLPYRKRYWSLDCPSWENLTK